MTVATKKASPMDPFAASRARFKALLGLLESERTASLSPSNLEIYLDAAVNDTHASILTGPSRPAGSTRLRFSVD